MLSTFSQERTILIWVEVSAVPGIGRLVSASNPTLRVERLRTSDWLLNVTMTLNGPGPLAIFCWSFGSRYPLENAVWKIKKSITILQNIFPIKSSFLDIEVERSEERRV